MTKEDAISRLQELVDRVATLEQKPRDHEDFHKWKTDARILLERLFPSDPEAVESFDPVPYDPPKGTLFGDGNIGPYLRSVFKQGLGKARAELQSRIDELNLLWEDNADLSGSGAATVQLTHPDSVFVIHGRQKLSDFHAFLRALGICPLNGVPRDAWQGFRRLSCGRS
ncbi:hypothetical protein EON82_07875 [bacterium]|nr:MAG: hypothetical protein EON82_07875 [bacterium]